MHLQNHNVIMANGISLMIMVCISIGAVHMKDNMLGLDILPVGALHVDDPHFKGSSPKVRYSLITPI